MLFTHLAKTVHFCLLMDWFLTSWTLKITSLLYLNENQCYKGIDILDTCGAMICSYFGIAFLLFFMRIENAVYTSCQNSALLFINGLIFDIMNTQNNQSLVFEWKPMLPQPMLKPQGFHGFVMFPLSYSKIGWILFRNAKEALKEMPARKCSYCRVANIRRIENKC